METLDKPISVLEPHAKIYYNKKSITEYISPDVLSLAYQDNWHGESDEIEINIQDKDNLWKDKWYPTKGDSISVQAGYINQEYMDCGTFEIDELGISSMSGDTMRISGVASQIKKALRTKKSVAHENKTLRQIAQKIGSKHGYQVVGNIPNIKFKRITQNKQSDLEFLKKLAEDYGYVFKIANDKLVFYKIEELEKAKPIMTFERKDLKSFDFTDKTIGTYKSCEVSYFDPKTKKLVSYTATNPNSTSEETLKLNGRCENKEQAMAKAKAGLAGKVKEIEGSLSVFGNTKICAGAVIEIKGLYKFSGKYMIKSCRHSISKGQDGYTTTMEVYKIA